MQLLLKYPRQNYQNRSLSFSSFGLLQWDTPSPRHPPVPVLGATHTRPSRGPRARRRASSWCWRPGTRRRTTCANSAPKASTLTNLGRPNVCGAPFTTLLEDWGPKRLRSATTTDQLSAQVSWTAESPETKHSCITTGGCSPAKTTIQDSYPRFRPLLIQNNINKTFFIMFDFTFSRLWKVSSG